jgi:hypothetical protein
MICVGGVPLIDHDCPPPPPPPPVDAASSSPPPQPNSNAAVAASSSPRSPARALELARRLAVETVGRTEVQ